MRPDQRHIPEWSEAEGALSVSFPSLSEQGGPIARWAMMIGASLLTLALAVLIARSLIGSWSVPLPALLMMLIGEAILSWLWRGSCRARRPRVAYA